MKNERKPKTPIFAAHSANKNDEEPVTQDKNGTKVRGSSRPKIADPVDISSLPEQDFIDQTPFMFTGCTRDLKYRFVSRAYAEMIGHKPEDIAGRPIREIMGEEGWESIAPYVDRVLSGERVEYEADVSFKDAGTHTLHVVYTPHRDERSDVIGWFASIIDISEQKNAEEERSRALQREQWQREVAEQAWVAAEEAKARAEQELSERKLAEAALGTWADAPLPQEARPLWLRYGVAWAVTTVVILLRGLLDPLLGSSEQYPLLLGAIAFSVWYGGVRPALFSLVFGYVGITWLVLGWQRILPPTMTTLTSLGIFILSSVIVMTLGETMRRAQRHAHWSAHVAAKRQRDAEVLLQEQQRVEVALRESEQRFRGIFETAGVSVWVEDFTEVKAAIEELRSQGIKDFRSYFISKPEFVRRAIRMVRILDVNHDTLHLFGASTKDELLGSLHTVFSPETEQAFLEELLVLAEGRDVYRSETQMRALDGRTISVLFTMHFNSLSGDYSRVIVTLTDITERKKIEQELARERELFKRLFETMPVMSTIYDPETQSMWMNRHIEQLTGWKQDEVDVVSLLNALYPDPAYLQQTLERMAAVADKNEWIDVQMQTRDGRTLDTLWANISILDGEKLLTGISLGIDITERKRAEEELRKARQAAEATADRMARLQEVTSALAKSITSSHLAELILEQGTRASGAAAGILMEVVNNGQDLKTIAALGYPPNAVRDDTVPLSARTPLSDAIQTKQTVWLLSHEEFAAQYPDLAELRRGFGNEAVVALPLIVEDRAIGGLAFSFAEKREFLLEERGFFLSLAQQCAQRLERVRAAEALRKSEQRFAGFMQHLPGLAWIKDMQGRYVYVNDAAEKAFRVPRSELYGRTDVEIFAPDVADQFRRNDEQTLHEAKGIQVVEELEHEDGILHYSLVNKFPILGSDGAVTLIGGMAIDITESKQAEDRLSLLAEISELARDSEDSEALMAAVADAVGKHLHVKRCLFNEIDVENDIEVVHHDYHDGVDSVAGVHRVTEYSSITSAEMIQGTTVVNRDSKTDPRTAPDYERSYLPNGERAYVAVPLMRESRWVASLWVSDNKPRRWTDEDVALLQTIAERTWTACEKLRIHAELRASEERLRVTFNTSAVGFAMLRPDTRFVDVNQAFCDILGYSRAELLTMNFDFLTHPDYVKSTRDHIRRLVLGKVPSSVIEKLYIRKDGSEVWVQNHMSLVRDVDGNPLHLIIISQDISERKQIETLQRNATQSLLYAAEANAKFRTFFDEGSYFAAVMTLDGTIVETNRLSLEFCGFTRDDVIGKKFWDCGWWSPSPALMEMIRKGTQEAARGKTFRQETAYFIADGRERFVDLMIAPIRDENGHVLFLAPTGTDITERKQAEEKLRQLNLLLEERVEKRTLQLETSDQLRRKERFERRQAQDRFAKSFKASPAAMTITRFEDGMYRNVNPKFIELLGYKLEEVIGRTTLDLKFYKNPGERDALLNSIRNNSGKWEYETKLETKTGRLLDVNISVVEIELDGEPHILSMIMDITERNHILAALRASEQQLRTLFDVLPVGISYLTQEGKVIESNRTLAKILDMTREEMQHGSHHSRQYIRPDGSPMPASEFASTRAFTEQRTINNVETGIIKEGGQVIWTSVSATPISMPDPGVVVITVDVTERKHMDDELRRSHRRYQILSQRLVEIQEEERRTISRELHDRVGQSLAALNLNLNFLNSSLSGTTSLPIKSRLKDAIQLTEETVSTIRDVMANLRPPALDDYGLEAALNAYVEPFSRRFGIRVVLDKPADPIPRMNPNIELTLLRIAQEALTNVARHANARQAAVTLRCQDDMVHLIIEDNGDGIRSWQRANRPGSHGLKIMRERAETFGGTMQVQSFSKKGTKIEVKIPIQGNDQSAGNTEPD